MFVCKNVVAFVSGYTKELAERQGALKEKLRFSANLLWLSGNDTQKKSLRATKYRGKVTFACKYIIAFRKKYIAERNACLLNK